MAPAITEKRRKIGARLAYLEKSRDWLAQALQIPASDFAREYGKVTVARDLAIANALGVRIGWLIVDSDQDVLQISEPSEFRFQRFIGSRRLIELCGSQTAISELSEWLKIREEQLFFFDRHSKTEHLLLVADHFRVHVDSFFTEKE